MSGCMLYCVLDDPQEYVPIFNGRSRRYAVYPITHSVERRIFYVASRTKDILMDDSMEDPESLFEVVEWLRQQRDSGEIDPEEFRKKLSETNKSWFDPQSGEATTSKMWIDPSSINPGVGEGRYDEDHSGWSGHSDPDSSNDGADGAYVREFDWRYRGYTASWELEVPKRLYRYYSQRARTRSFGTYIADPFDREYIQELIDRIEEFCSENGIPRDEIADVALRFVQHFEYAKDEVTQGVLEYPKFPMETLLHEGGDCEDSSIILGAILRELGYDVTILLLPNKHHMMLGVSLDSDVGGAHVEHEGTAYTLVETTNPGWDFGSIPPKYNGASTQVHPVSSQPVLVHRWEAEPTGNGKIKVEGHLANFGTAPAKEIDVVFSLETQDEQVVSGDTVSSIDFLARSKSESFSGSVTTPDVDDPRGRLRLILGCSIHDASTSHFR